MLIIIHRDSPISIRNLLGNRKINSKISSRFTNDTYRYYKRSDGIIYRVDEPHFINMNKSDTLRLRSIFYFWYSQGKQLNKRKEMYTPTMTPVKTTHEIVNHLMGQLAKRFVVRSNKFNVYRYDTETDILLLNDVAIYSKGMWFEENFKSARVTKTQEKKLCKDS